MVLGYFSSNSFLATAVCSAVLLSGGGFFSLTEASRIQPAAPLAFAEGNADVLVPPPPRGLHSNRLPKEKQHASTTKKKKGPLASNFPQTALDEYVYRDDGAFSITDLNITYDNRASGYKIHLFNFTSQKWLTPEDSNRHIWWHILAVVIPDNVDYSLDSTLLYIAGGNNNPNWVPKASETDLIIASTLALGTNSTAAVLYQVPNQGISFPSDPWQKGMRSEDSTIAFTWWHYVQFPDQPEWVLELPMAKAGVKALDALEIVVPKLLQEKKLRDHEEQKINTGFEINNDVNSNVDETISINKFIVAGASKRGWTTWLVGAAEAGRNSTNSEKGCRILAIIPIVLDALNMHSFMHRHYTSLGGWSFALRDYVDANITVDLDHPNLKHMFTFIDAYYFKDRYVNIPKFVISAGGDEFQLPDNHRYFGHDLAGETKFLLVKNAEHAMITGLLDLIPAVTSYVISIQADVAAQSNAHHSTPTSTVVVSSSRPEIEWSISDATGAITAKTSVAPKSFQVIYSDSPLGPSRGRRDFRWAALDVEPCIKIFGGCLRPVLWAKTKDYVNVTTTDSSSSSTSSSKSVFVASMPLVPGHFRAFTLEFKFANPHNPKYDFLFTVPISIIPNIYPFPDCQGSGCGTTLV